MYITRGTTPTHIFSVPIVKEEDSVSFEDDLNNLYSLKIVYSQVNKVVISKEWIAAFTVANSGDTPKVHIININGEEFDSREDIVLVEPKNYKDVKAIEVDVNLSYAESLVFDSKHFVKVQLSFIEKKKDKEGNFVCDYTESPLGNCLPGDSSVSDLIYLAVLDNIAERNNDQGNGDQL